VRGAPASILCVERPEYFARALERGPDDIKVVVQFADV